MLSAAWRSGRPHAAAPVGLTIRHCPRCGAMQPDQPRCGVCGAKLGGGGRGDDLSAREILHLAGALIFLMAGFVLAGALVLGLVFWLLT